MGLSIHYSGSAINENSIGPLVTEVMDICKTLQWEFHLFDDKNFKGICFSSLKSEPIFLTFMPDGRLCSPVTQMTIETYKVNGIDEQYWYTESTKTQYAGMDAHIAIIKLLKYISKKYLKDFMLNDEGNYWETGDKDVLQAQFNKYELAMNFVNRAMQNIMVIEGEPALSIAERVEQILKQKLKGDTKQ